MEYDFFLLGASAEGVLVNLAFPKSFFPFLAGLLSWGHLESISRILEADCSNALAFALTAFSMASSQEFKSCLWASN